jgi:hypothetical protein
MEILAWRENTARMARDCALAALWSAALPT